MKPAMVAPAPRVVTERRLPIWTMAMPWLFVVIWSSGFVVARYAMPHSPPLKFLSLRYALSACCFGAWILISRPPWPKGRAQWLHLAVVGLLVQAGYLGGVWTAVKAGIGAGTVALVVGLQPLLTAIWSSWAGRGVSVGTRSRVSPQQWCGLAFGLGGLLLVVWHKLGGGEITAWNLTMALLALLSITTGTLYQKRFVAAADVRTASVVQLLASLAISLPAAWLLETGALVWHPQLIGALVWSVLVLTLGGSSIFYLLIQRGAATKVTSLMYLVPPGTALMAWLLFDEPLTSAMLVGMLLTAVGVALVLRPGKG